MPLLAGGIQGVDTVTLMIPLFEAATQWITHGLQLETLKIVASSERTAEELRGAFGVLRRQYKAPRDPLPPKTYDLFISYSWKNKDAVDAFAAELRRQRPSIRLFLDRLELKPGSAWQQQIFDALDDCRTIVTFYSPDYLASADAAGQTPTRTRLSPSETYASHC
jgi:hypothetical protein